MKLATVLMVVVILHTMTSYSYVTARPPMNVEKCLEGCERRYTDCFLFLGCEADSDSEMCRKCERGIETCMNQCPKY